MTTRAANDAGFTLVEALVSLFVFSLIAAGCAALLMQGVDTQKRVAIAQASLREVQMARSLLANDLLQIAPRRVRLAEGGHAPVFAGAAQTGIAFVRAAAEPTETGVETRLAQVTYVISEGRVLRRSRASLDVEGAQAGEGAVSERVVLAQAGNARFEFYDGAAWRETWSATGPEGMPRAVALAWEAPRYGALRIEAIIGGAP